MEKEDLGMYALEYFFIMFTFIDNFLLLLTNEWSVPDSKCKGLTYILRIYMFQ